MPTDKTIDAPNDEQHKSLRAGREERDDGRLGRFAIQRIAGRLIGPARRRSRRSAHGVARVASIAIAW